MREMREMPPDLYALIGVAPNATQEEILRAYEAFARQLSAYPDAESLRQVSEAYRVLASPPLRAQYDAQRRVAGVYGEPVRPTGRPVMPGGALMSGDWIAAGAPLDVVLTLGAPVSASLEEPERFYLLAELGPAGSPDGAPPARLNLALMIPRSIAQRDPRLEETRRALRALTERLRLDDRLTLVVFDDYADLLLDGEPVAGRAGVETLLDGRPPSGAPRLAAALGLTLERLAAHTEPSSVSTLALIVDEAAGDEDETLLDLAEQAQRLGVAIAALGIGLDWDRDLLDQMADASGGTCAFVDDPRSLTPMLTELEERLRATLASRMRLTLEPSPGVSVLRAAQIAPGLASVFEGPHTPGAPVAVALGALASAREIPSSAALWETLLEPSTLTLDADGRIDLGVIEIAYWAPWQQGGRMVRARRAVRPPRSTLPGPLPVAPDIRLALELLTAYRLQERADHLISMGDREEARAALDMSAERLALAGATRLAEEARQASRALSGGQEQGKVIALRALYGMRTHSPFRYLRRSRSGAPGA
jgi:Ca-activated chloride channel homolog